MDDLAEQKQQIIDKIQQLRTSQSEAALESQEMREQLQAKEAELGTLETIKQTTKGLSESGFKALPSSFKVLLAKYRG